MNYKQICTNFSDLLISFVNKSMGGDGDPFADLPPFVFPLIGGAIIFFAAVWLISVFRAFPIKRRIRILRRGSGR